MKICIITGSPRKNGTTSRLTDSFIKGASENGHEIYRFDAAFKNIHPCDVCGACQGGQNPCKWNDDINDMYPHLIEADVVVFVSPIYLSGMTAQLKMCIDRTCAVDTIIHHNKKSALILAAGDWDRLNVDGADKTYLGFIDYFDWENIGIIDAMGVYEPEDLEGKDYIQKAYDLGNSI